MAATVELRPATGEDLGFVERLLAANGLPTEDVHEKPECFYVATDGTDVGVGGVEVHGDAGLLRSVVVREPNRGAGYGAALCEALEARAAAAGVETLYLLTTTATDFFAGQGYEAVQREAAPRRIRETSQFAELCPTSATCMAKEL